MACRDRDLPQSFVSRCRSCHSTSNEQNSRYPDLFAFSGSAEQFVAQVRKGGGVMPAFLSSDISDDDLARVFAFFSGTAREQIELGAVKPLFEGPSPVVPITFLRDDGVLVTRAAGRVRQRHELEGTFGPFGPHYFEDRSYGFIVEDFTPRGESRIRVTYLPIAMPEQNTNFRCWKIYGDGNVFHSNLGMSQNAALPDMTVAGRALTKSYAQDIAPYAFSQSQEQTRNAREGREIKKGDLFEFEFGVFIEQSAVQPNTRTSYYSDTFRYQVGLGGLTARNADSSGVPGPEPLAQQGGTTTGAWLYAEPETSFEQLALNLQHEHVQMFLEGRRLFHTDFETGNHSESGNPVFGEQMGKAGPLLTTTSCVTCHDKNGGGRPLEGALSRTSSMVFKLYDAAELGDQLQLEHR
jgi:mono/diheme cytochrome c family protein